MRKIIFTLIILYSISISSQNYSNIKSLPKNEIGQGILHVNASSIAGIFYYGQEKVIKKIKIKVKDGSKKTLIIKGIKKYNEAIKELSDSNAKELSDIDVIIKSTATIKDNKVKAGVLKIASVFIEPIKNEVDILEKKLNDNFNTFLSEKEFKKWMKYQSYLKEKNQPKIAVKRVLRYEQQTKVIRN
ncbi:hypothetical protein [Polaribacter sp. Asnod1-A03]|uniref:hypothetical protein n=1 Tax=Polaribacter sp. Asnod1-A03 TaxID=3160581 RepID=UPI0038648A00